MVCSMLDVAMSPAEQYKTLHGVCAAKQQAACSGAPCSESLCIRLQDTNPCNTSPYAPVHVALSSIKYLVDTISTLGNSGAGGLGRPSRPYNWTNSPQVRPLKLLDSPINQLAKPYAAMEYPIWHPWRVALPRNLTSG